MNSFHHSKVVGAGSEVIRSALGGGRRGDLRLQSVVPRGIISLPMNLVVVEGGPSNRVWYPPRLLALL